MCSCFEGVVWSQSERLSGALWTGQSIQKRSDGTVTVSHAQLHDSDLQETQIDHEFFMSGQILSYSEHFCDHYRNYVTVCSSRTLHVSFSPVFCLPVFLLWAKQNHTNDVGWTSQRNVRVIFHPEYLFCIVTSLSWQQHDTFTFITVIFLNS